MHSLRTRVVLFALVSGLFSAQLRLSAQKTVTAADAGPVPSAVSAPDRAWTMLTETSAVGTHLESRIEALAALGSMRSNEHANRLIAMAFNDRDIDIRTAAVLAAGESKSARLIPDLRRALDDPEPQVAYTAAVTLWKLHDRTGEDLLMAVASGERRAGATLVKGAGHSASRLLRNPAGLAKIGAQQGAGMLLGPFGMGITAVEYARKNGGDSARMAAIGMLAEQHTGPIHAELLSALADKDPLVRGAAAKALGEWHDAATAKALTPLLDDTKLLVRLDAAAGLLRSISSGSGSDTTHGRKARQ